MNWLADMIAHWPKCYLEGEFNLASGGKDSNYIDLWVLLTNRSILSRIAMQVLGQTRELDYNTVGGCELASMPIADAVMMRQAMVSHTFLVRKQPKTTGPEKLVEGSLQPSDRALVVEDVTSTGKSVAHAVEAVLDLGVTVVGIMACVDREEGAHEMLQEKFSLDFRSITTLSEIRKALWSRGTEEIQVQAALNSKVSRSV